MYTFLVEAPRSNVSLRHYVRSLQSVISRGVVEAIRAHTAYGYFDTACGSVWVVIEVRMGSN